MPWQQDLIGKLVLVLSANIVGKVSQVYEAGTFLRADATPDELPVQKPVIQLDSGHAFLADDATESTFYVLSPRDELVFESVQESFKNAVGMAFRVAVAAQVEPEMAITFVMAGLEEAHRALSLPPEVENAQR